MDGKVEIRANCRGLRFDKAIFQSHPEFPGEVRAFDSGRMLVVADAAEKARRRDSDPVIEAFARIEALAGHLPFNPHEDLGDDALV